MPGNGWHGTAYVRRRESRQSPAAARGTDTRQARPVTLDISLVFHRDKNNITILLFARAALGCFAYYTTVAGK